MITIIDNDSDDHGADDRDYDGDYDGNYENYDDSDDYGDDDHGYAEPRPLHSCCNCGIDPGKPHVNAHSVIPGDKKEWKKIVAYRKKCPWQWHLEFFYVNIIF